MEGIGRPRSVRSARFSQAMALKLTVKLQSNIRLDQSNIRLTRIELKYVAFN